MMNHHEMIIRSIQAGLAAFLVLSLDWLLFKAEQVNRRWQPSGWRGSHGGHSGHGGHTNAGHWRDGHA